MTDNGNSSLQEFFDVGKLLEQLTIPGVNVAALIEGQRKNIEAVTEANRIAFEGWQTLVYWQAEILQDTLKQTVANAGQENEQTDLARQGFEKVLSIMRELAELSTRSHKQACEVARQQMEEIGATYFGHREEKR